MARRSKALTVPERPQYVIVHERLLDKVHAVEAGFMELAGTIAEAVEIKVWEHYDCTTPDAYFRGQIRLEPRSWRRLLLVHEGVMRLPEHDRPEAIVALAQVGRHKAGVLAPLLGATVEVPSERPGQAATEAPIDWRRWVEYAQKPEVNEKRLQEAVSEARGIPAKPPRGTDFDHEFYAMVMARLPEGEKVRVEKLWTLFRAQATDAANGRDVGWRGAFLLLWDLAQQELGAHGVEVAATV